MNLIDTKPTDTNAMDTALAALVAAGIGFDVVDAGPDEGTSGLDVAA